MDFKITEEQTIIKDSLMRFLKKEISPLVEEYETKQKYITPDIVKKLQPYGFTTALIPEKLGGIGLDYVTYGTMIEQLAYIWGSLRTIVSITSMATKLVALHGTEKQKEEFLPRLMSMEDIGCFALTEPNVGSDTASIQTKALRNGDHYLLNGTKTLITAGSMADVVCVYATVDKSKKAKGVTAFLVKKDQSVFQTKDIRKMGMRCAPLSEIFFKDCKVPAENRLGDEGSGLKIALEGLNSGRIIVTFVVVGVAQAALDASVRYAKERPQFGKAIGSFQLVQDMIVDMAMKVDIGRLLGYRAASMLDNGIDCRREASFAKLFSTEAALDVVSKAIQVHGGYGYTEEYPIERYYRDIRHLTIAEGTTQIQKLILGRDILGLSAFV